MKAKKKEKNQNEPPLSIEAIKESKKPAGKAQSKLQKDVIILKAAVKYLASTKTPEEYKTFASLFPEIAE